ncbi:MAG: histidine kinase [Hymenobacteraceae bacterium]|nr:histidine kinase [Hymenobacteraceae bacterium]
MPDVLLIIAVGTGLFLLLGIFIAFMTLSYQRKRLQHQEEVKGLAEAYQQEILRAQLEMQEQTFLSIAQEIHDNVGQTLSLVRLHVSTLEGVHETANRHKITTSKELLDQAIEDLRGLSRRLNTRYVTQQSLPVLLRMQLEQIQRSGAVHTSFEVQGKEKELDPEKKLIIFRIAQEALSNSLRHAEADSISARIVYAEGSMSLSISDNGKGFTVPDPTLAGSLPPGTGTANMRYRAKLIGATLLIRGKLGEGTLVSLEYSLN